MDRRDLLRAGVATGAILGTGLVSRATSAQEAGDAVRKLAIISRPQSNNPQAYQAAEMIAQEWRKLGLDVEVRPMPRQQQSDIVWHRRQDWDLTMWQMVGRPERSDPDEFVYNLFHSSAAPTGYNFVGWISPEYDQVAEAQRRETDPARRQALIRRAQELVSAAQPYMFLVHPEQVHRLQQDAAQGRHAGQPGRPRPAQHLDLSRRRAARRPQGHDAQRVGADAADPPAVDQRRHRQLGHRTRLRPADAHRPRRPAQALVGGERDLRQPDHARPRHPPGHEVA